MCWRQWLELRSGTGAVAVASFLIAVLLFGTLAAACHHDCHATCHKPCAICLCANAPSCLPEVTLPPPTPAVAQELVLLPVSRPNSRPLLPITPRGPPLGFV